MRTDRTTLCAPCQLRFPAAQRCPRCRRVEVFDLTRPAARRGALVALDRRAHGQGEERLQARSMRHAFYLAIAGTVAGALMVVFSTLNRPDLPGLGVLDALERSVLTVVGVAVLALCLVPPAGGLLHLVYEVLDPVLRLARAALFGTAQRVVPTDEQELSPGMPVSRLTGHVRATEAFESPLSHRPCVAARLVGEGPLGPVDDVFAVDFDVETDDGERVRVSSVRASVEIEVSERPVPIRPDRALGALLEERGVFPARGPVFLSEALLVEGDAVIIEGHLGDATGRASQASVYRDTAPRREMSAGGGASLVIRRSLRARAR